MSIQLKISNKLEQLAELLREDLQVNTGNVFSKTTIITQTNGMNRWLSIYLAGCDSVFANFEFMRPNAFIDQLFRLAGIEASEFYSPERLKWPIFSLLGSSQFQAKFKGIATYFGDDEMKQLQLAGKTADLFDQYSIYRPDYIEHWSRGKSHPELKPLIYQEQWQSWLWKQLRENFPGHRDFDRVTRAKRLREIIGSDKDFIYQLKANIRQASVFGLSVITPLHIELFSLLAKHIPVTFYLVNPSPDTYWYDTKSEKQLSAISDHQGQQAEELLFEQGNELLTNYGKVLRDAFLQLFEKETLNTLDDTRAVAPVPESLLGKIQHDIYLNSLKEKQPVTTADLNDQSVSIVSAYTEVRELEALHDFLLERFNRDKELQPKDIIVLTPDIDLYTPYISAVFNSVPTRQYIPYSIADRSYTGGDNIVGVIQKLLELSEDAFTSERVVQLLDSAYIRDRYGITQVEVIRERIREANIRTGITGSSSDNTELVSWAHGIRRLVLGYAMTGEEPFEEYGKQFLPVASMEGEAGREMLRFIGLVDDLVQSLKLRKHRRTLKAWKDYISEHILERFLIAENENDREFKYVVSKLTELDEIADTFAGEIDFDVFRKALTELLFSETRAGEFITGAVTFSTIIPMRSLPFKVVALLGLDNKKFPRTHVEPAFNLINALPRRGDRNLKDNDKHLFLETLLAAKRHLYLSYKGNDIKDNTKLPPSLLIDELISYIKHSCKDAEADVEKALLTRHPLQSFSKKYNDPKGKLYSFAITETAAKVASDTLPHPPAQETQNITLDQLIRFLKNPFKWFYNKTLQMYYGEEEVLLPEHELFELNNLEKYALREMLVRPHERTVPERLINEGKETGKLPLANMATVVLEQIRESFATVIDTFDSLTAGLEVRSESHQIDLGEKTLEANIDGIYGNRLIAFSLSDSKSKDGSRKYILEAWLKHVALIAAAKPVDTLFIWKFSDTPVVIPKDILSTDKAKKILIDLAGLYQTGLQRIVPFDPAIGFNYVYNSWTLEKSFKKLKEMGENDYNKDFFDPYYRREIRQGFFEEQTEGIEESQQLFKLAANTVWRPLYENGQLFE